ncbi:hypothetical protein, partial [Selenomonas sp.]|uniref:hypothetical protein n=1 Tax=Selenomonas sp. TaxID=2053611 RepID=UPI0025D62BED
LRPVFHLVRTKKSTPIWQTSFYQCFLAQYTPLMYILLISLPCGKIPAINPDGSTDKFSDSIEKEPPRAKRLFESKI